MVIPEKTPLCEDCRNLFIKFPIPKWIKGFGIGILAVLIFSLVSLSKYLQTGIEYERGLKAEENRNYLTAQRHFQKVVEKEPDYKEGQSHLLIAAFYNGDFETVRTTYGNLEHKTFEEDDQAIVEKVTAVLDRYTTYMPSDSFMTVIEKHGKNIDSIPAREYVHFLQQHPTDLYAACSYAYLLEDQKRHAEADSILTAVLAMDAENKTALSLKVPVKREINQFDSAYYYVNQMLAINHEDLFAFASKARVLLKEKKDDEALQLAQKCREMDEHDAYSLATLALVYHFKKEIKERDKIMARLGNDSTAGSSAAYVQAVISGKEIFRN
jgi:tetratricopeptide (TPR) repeat protein